MPVIYNPNNPNYKSRGNLRVFEDFDAKLRNLRHVLRFFPTTTKKAASPPQHHLFSQIQEISKFHSSHRQACVPCLINICSAASKL